MSFRQRHTWGDARRGWLEKSGELTDMNVPGKKNKVTRVIILIDTVSSLVFWAIFCILSVIFSMFSADT